ncbi:MAG: hypothetical protein K2L98_02255 [Bacilli bacterium]|nr:hypothetical protein [Bacilli bacterium]
MEYTVAELRNNILSRLYDLGINSNFKENPALSSALAEIDDLIAKIPSKNLKGEGNVKQQNNAITYTCIDEDDNAYAFGITSYEPNSFKCFFLTEKHSIPMDGEPMQQRSVIEKNVSLESNNYLTITTFGSTIDDHKCQVGKCNNTVWQELERFSAEGIMMKKEINNYVRGQLQEDFKTVSIDSMLYIPRKANISSDERIESLRTKRVILSREYLDIARLFIEDKVNQTTFISSVPLNQENGLRTMVVDEIYLTAPKEVIIPPVEGWEVDLMITSESNPKVQEGLKGLSNDRTSFSYDSATNKLFERKGFNDEVVPEVNK